MRTLLNLESGEILSEAALSRRTLADLKGAFADEAARAALPQETEVYRVLTHENGEREGQEGGLFFGTSFVNPGKVGGEYFMTKGHYHAKRNTAEYYFCISGRGALILMDEAGHTWMEEMERGTLHYIPRNVAHRLANTGDEVLAVGCCWSTECGHDYASIAEKGFTRRLMEVEGKPRLI